MRALRASAVFIAYALLAVQLAFAATLLIAQWNDHRYLSITGGSMAPKYNVGDAVLLDVADRENPQAGDVITFWTGPGEMTTHRVVSKHTVQGDEYLRTQGDANNAPDPDLVPVTAVVGTPEGLIPLGGYVAEFLLSPLGLLLTYGPVLTLILVSQIDPIRRWFTDRNGTPRDGEPRGQDTDSGITPGLDDEVAVVA